MSTTPPPKTPGAADLAKLEQLFATDPASDAYKLLAEAYIGMSRFMEAMVVCKKGIKAHPNSAEPKVLLARVYAAQAKDKKALEELTGALAVAPNDKAALRMAGALQLKTGDEPGGRANLLKAYAVDPADAETRALMAQWKIDAASVAAPAPAPAQPAPVAAPTAAVPVAPSAPSVAAAPSATAPAKTPQPAAAPPAAAAPPPAAAPARRVSSAAVPAARTAVRQAQRPVVHETEEDHEEAPSRRRSGGVFSGGKVTFALVTVCMLGLVGYLWSGRAKAQRTREVRIHLTEARDNLRPDTYSGYVKVTEATEEALKADPESLPANGMMAYAWTVRWGEHGGGDAARARAEEHLRAAEDLGGVSEYVVAARALFDMYSGRPIDARTALEQKIKEFEAQNKASALLYLTQGLLQTNAGDLVRARESLEKAQAKSASDPRVYAALGNLYRRQAQDAPAAQNFGFALKYEKGHPESVLGLALLELEKDDPDYAKAAAGLKQLLEQEPPPSPRQLSTAHLARSLLVSRVSAALPNLKPEAQKTLSTSTYVPTERPKAEAEISKEESEGFALDRNNPELYLLKAKRLLFEKQTDPAVATLREAIKADPTRAQFYVELARALMTKPGGEKEAAEALSTALKTMGDSPKLMVLLGQAYEKQGKLDEAAAQYKLATEGKAKNPEARLALGKLLLVRKDYAKAIEAFEKATQDFVGQDARVAETYGELGRVYEDKGDRPKADETYQKALNTDESFATPYFYYARFLASEGKGAKASELAKHYLELDPKGPFAADAQKLVQ